MDSGRALVTLGDLGQIRHACQGFLLGFFFFFFLVSRAFSLPGCSPISTLHWLNELIGLSSFL